MISITKNHDKFDIIVTLLGSISEWYEFVVYGFSAPILAPLFFPNQNKSISILLALGAFAAGFLMRPLGALIYGHFGDKIGRRKTLSMSIILMGLPTVVMGLLPTYHQIGFLAPLVLIMIRLLQGVSVGGQFTGSAIFIGEHVRRRFRYFGAGLTFCGAFAGMLLASFIGVLLTKLLSSEQLHAWGWRIPFLLGIIVSIIGFYLRRHTLETPAFLNIERKQKIVTNPIGEVFANQKRLMCLCALICWLAPIIVYLLFIFMPTYVNVYLHIPLEEALYNNTIAMLVLTISALFFGFAADRLTYRLVMVSAALLLFIFAWPLYMLLAHAQQHHRYLLMAQILFALFSGGFIGPMMSVLTFLFPTSIRYTALSFSYNLGCGVFGGTAALIATFLVERTGHVSAPGIYVAITALISGSCVILSKRYIRES
ncbi:MAG: MFS transporter [Pseudomonadota bacterium]